MLPFASQVIIELHSSEECSSEQCFWVEVLYNGKLLAFEECENWDRCTFPEFMEVLNQKGFVYTRTHYEEECARPWSPRSNSVMNLLYRHWGSPAYSIYDEPSSQRRRQ